MFRKAYITLFCLFALSLASCSSMNMDIFNGDPVDSNAPSVPVGAASAGTGLYYFDIGDILVPGEMTIDNDDSFIVETSTAKAGFLVFSGSAERVSLTNYFLQNMRQQGWVKRSSFMSKRTILVFEKPGRICVININDGAYKTDLEIWVSPITSNSPAQAPVPPVAVELEPGDPDGAISSPGTIPAASEIEEKPLSQ